MDDDDESYLLLLLSDSNLPTGSFVASSGLESYTTHGFSSTSSSPPSSSIINFVRDSLASYAHSALPFVTDAHRVITAFRTRCQSRDHESSFLSEDIEINEAAERLVQLDELYEAMTLNHVARRASKAQGIALLTLYSKGFSRPASLAQLSSEQVRPEEMPLSKLLDRYKAIIRRDEAPGHLPVCWGILTCALGLNLDRARYLHLFLQARGLLSASVRLNDIGPYGAQQILLHVVRSLVAQESTKSKDLTTGIPLDEASLIDGDGCKGMERGTNGPANTWPLGEILAARHDLQHSRIFNS